MCPAVKDLRFSSADSLFFWKSSLGAELMEDEDLPTRSCSAARLCEPWGLLDRSRMLEHRVALPGAPHLANGAREQSRGLVAGG